LQLLINVERAFDSSRGYDQFDRIWRHASLHKFLQPPVFSNRRMSKSSKRRSRSPGRSFCGRASYAPMRRSRHGWRLLIRSDYPANAHHGTRPRLRDCEAGAATPSQAAMRSRPEA
jgi:hypothetical protein